MKTLQPDTLIKNPDSCHIVSSVDITADARSVWRVAGDFSGFAAFVPALSHTEMTGTGVGSLRKKFFDNGNLAVEQLNSWDDQAMSMTWSALYNTLGISNLWASMSVDSLSASMARATWTIIAEPCHSEDLAPEAFQSFIQNFADTAMLNLSQLFPQA